MFYLLYGARPNFQICIWLFPANPWVSLSLLFNRRNSQHLLQKVRIFWYNYPFAHSHFLILDLSIRRLDALRDIRKIDICISWSVMILLIYVEHAIICLYIAYMKAAIELFHHALFNQKNSSLFFTAPKILWLSRGCWTWFFVFKATAVISVQWHFIFLVI